PYPQQVEWLRQMPEWLRQMPVEQWSGSPQEVELLRRLDALLRRERQLWAAHHYAILGEIPGLTTFVAAWPEDVGWFVKRSGANAIPIRAVFARGFVEAIT